jgi:hypothetical protein
MRLGDLVVEAWRNVRVGASRALISGALLVPTVLGLAWLDMSQVASAEREAIAYRDAGAATFVIADTGQIDGARCDGLGEQLGVQAAGALRSAEAAFVPLVTPRNAIPQYDITPGLARQLHPGYTTGLALDAATADALGIGPGQLLRGIDGDAAMMATYAYPDDGRDQKLAYALTRSGAASGRYDECWLALWPPDATAAGVLLTATLAPGADPNDVRVGQLNVRLGASFDAPARFTSRSGQSAPLVAFLLALGVTIGVARLRRLELALARHLGLGRLEVAALLAFEAAIVAVPATLFGAAATAAYAASTRLDQVWPFGLRVLALALLGVAAGSVVAGLTAREKRLFDYFKER